MQAPVFKWIDVDASGKRQVSQVFRNADIDGKSRTFVAVTEETAFGNVYWIATVAQLIPLTVPVKGIDRIRDMVARRLIPRSAPNV